MRGVWASTGEQLALSSDRIIAAPKESRVSTADLLTYSHLVIQPYLWLTGVVTRAYKLSAARTASPILPAHGRRQIDIHDVRNGRKPSNNVGKLGRLVLGRALAQSGRQLAHFFHQPHECAVDASGNILLEVHLTDERLKVFERDGLACFRHNTRPVAQRPNDLFYTYSSDPHRHLAWDGSPHQDASPTPHDRSTVLKLR